MNKDFFSMKINELAELIEEYEQRITAAVEAHGYEVIINHTLLNKET